MRLLLQKYFSRLVAVSLLLWLSATFALAQTTSFTYQGRLSDGGTPANGPYDLQFTLWDSNSGGTQQPQPSPVTVTRTSVLVTGGIFTVQLDFGASAFPGADRFLEIGVRPAGGGAFTILSLRQQITSTPYAIRSLNASSADAVTVSGVPGGSGNYIQNNPASQQAGSFNISGNGTAAGTLSSNIVNATTQYNIGGNRVLSTSFGNLFAGFNAGRSTMGSDNSGNGNAFFGSGAGRENTSGSGNSFFGASAGQFNQGLRNSFFGFAAGVNNDSGSDNTIIGSNADVGANNTNATAIGADARVGQSNSLVLGSVVGFGGATSSVNVGIGTTMPQARLHVNGDTLVQTSGSGGNIQFGTPGGETGMTIIKRDVFNVNQLGRVDLRYDGLTLKLVTIGGPGVPASTSGVAITNLGNVGIGTTLPSAKLNVRGPGSANILRVENSAGQDALLVSEDRTVGIGLLSSSPTMVHVCIDFLNRLSFCGSSLRYKENVAPFSIGLELIRRLRPIRFTWKNNGTPDLGLGAEDVAKVEPLLVTHNDKGEIQGVKYDQLNVVLINAIKQQQDQIEQQQGQIKAQQRQLEAARAANSALSTRLRVVEKVVRKKLGSARRRR